MSEEAKNERNDQLPQLSLREFAHAREMDLLAIAERSQHKDIRRYALQSAKAERKHTHRQEARISSRIAFSVSVVAGLLASVISFHAFLSYPRTLALKLTMVSFGGAILLSVFCFVFSDKLEASAAVEFFRNLFDKVKSGSKGDESKI